MSSAELCDPCIRPLLLDDLPEVAELFASVFRPGQAVRMEELISHLRSIYLEGPWQDDEIRSLVHLERRGRIDGFLGVFAVPMIWRGESIRAGITSALMVRNPGSAPLRALQLARAHLAGPQMLTLCDTANFISLDLAKELQFAVLHTDSLDWISVLRPTEFGRNLLRQRGNRMLAGLIAPATLMADRLLQGAPNEDNSTPPDREVSLAEFAQSAIRLSSLFELRPDWDCTTVEWQLQLAAQKRAWGKLYARQVLSPNGKLLGIYLYYAKSGGIATVLQILAQPRMMRRVLQNLHANAAQCGCIAVQGRSSTSTMDEIIRLPNVFLRHRASTVLHSRLSDLTAAALAGRALIGGLVGDSWTRLSSDAFD